MNEPTRAYIYRIIVTLIPLLISFGVLASEDAALYFNLAAAVLGLGATGLAVRNTSTKTNEG